MDNQARAYLVAHGLAPAALPPFGAVPVPLLPPFGDYEEVDAMNNEGNDEAWAVEGDLGRMLTWEDIDEYHLYKFTTGRSFKLRGFYENKLVEFYERIFYAYPEEVRSGAVAYDPNIHNQQTHVYEAQLQRLEERIADEHDQQRQGQDQGPHMN
jgi:hypothetical protein